MAPRAEARSGSGPLSALLYAVYIIVGVSVGQLAAWVVGLLAAFANITGIVAALLGEYIAVGFVFVVATAAYAIVVGIAASMGLAVLAGTDDPGDAEAWAGVLAGAVAFLLTSWLAEPYVRFVIETLPAAATFVANSTGFMGFAAAVLLQAVPVGFIAVAGYLLLRALRPRARDDQSQA